MPFTYETINLPDQLSQVVKKTITQAVNATHATSSDRIQVTLLSGDMIALQTFDDVDERVWPYAALALDTSNSSQATLDMLYQDFWNKFFNNPLRQLTPGNFKSCDDMVDNVLFAYQCESSIYFSMKPDGTYLYHNGVIETFPRYLWLEEGRRFTITGYYFEKREGGGDGWGRPMRVAQGSRISNVRFVTI